MQFFDWLVRYARIFRVVMLHFCIPYHGENQLDNSHAHVAQALFNVRTSLLSLESFQQTIATNGRVCEVRVRLLLWLALVAT